MRKLWEHLEIPLIKGQRFLLHLRLIYAGDEEKLLRPKLHSGQNQAFFLAITIFCENLRKWKLQMRLVIYEAPIPVLSIYLSYFNHCVFRMESTCPLEYLALFV